jgi:LysR family transcriptional activator of nhaA
MSWINYHHLLYFYTVAEEGSVTAAAKKLHLSQPTLSSQLHQLEEDIGEKLLEKRGRGLVLTETGQVVYRYAQEIFGLGREMMEAVAGRPTQKVPRFTVGISDVLPKLVVYHLLEPALLLPGGVRLSCREEPMDRLLAALSLHELDMVLTDAPLPAMSGIRAYSHLLGESSLSFFAAPPLARKMNGAFPECLHQQPILFPAETAALRRPLEQWLERHGIRPEMVAEVDDSALLKVFGRAGLGFFVAPTVTEVEVCRQYDVVCIGRVDELKERFYAISVERRIRHPAVAAISVQAHQFFR